MTVAVTVYIYMLVYEPVTDHSIVGQTTVCRTDHGCVGQMTVVWDRLRLSRSDMAVWDRPWLFRTDNDYLKQTMIDTIPWIIN